jgi:hypothetical protein
VIVGRSSGAVVPVVVAQPAQSPGSAVPRSAVSSAPRSRSVQPSRSFQPSRPVQPSRPARRSRCW